MKKGTKTKECLSDFLKRNGKPVTFSEFARVSPSTVRRWETGESEPIGENLLRVKHFFDLCGYEVAELATLKPLIFEIGQAIAVGCTTLDEVAKTLGVDDYHQILRYLRGEVEPSPERTSALGQLATEKRQSLAAKLAEIRQTLREENLLVKREPATNGNDSERTIAEFEAVCKDALRLATVFRQGSLELRAAMRRRMASGSEPLLHITWEALNGLIQEPTKQ